jgi:uncharacterized protein (DUF362 family)
MAKVTRREALARIGTAALIVGATAAVGRACADREGPGRAQRRARSQVRDYRLGERSARPADLAVARQGADPATLTRAAVAALGGMKSFVGRGETVAIKPNIGWDRTPAHAANTNPAVVATLVALALEAGASRVVVSDVSCNEPARCFQRSGIWQAAHDAGAEVVLPAEHRFRMLDLGGEVLDEWPVYRPIVDADRVINVPVAKHHNLARYSGAMKNWYGLLGGRRNRLHQRIGASIADLATFLRPTLTVIDATRVLRHNGPQGGNLADVAELGTVIASVDQVAADAYACALVGASPAELEYLALGQARGLGTLRWEALRRVEV